MKKIIFVLAALTSFLLTSCYYGVYSVNSGMADEGYICFVDTSSYDITVQVDNEQYQTQTIKQKKEYKKRRDIKKTSQNKIALKPGKHVVKVMHENKEVYSQILFISANEFKIINL